ncbi:MAG: LLM class flavin-dependent oxidoreductase [Salana multivorans]|nr:LLM class flavin-dependent oxidoreductase [Salana multivorans]
MRVKLSVLDLIPVRSGQSTTEALRASRTLLGLADSLGFERYWVAEHHNMPAVASSVPGVLLPYLAGGTTRIRLGSGGVMLPNHTALDVAEQFALLEAMFPGRVDLGIGRAPGSDPVTSYLLRFGRPDAAEESFEQDVLLLRELLGLGETPVGEPVRLSLGGRPFDVRATPRAASPTGLWLLGSSGFSVELAARLGLPYVFANHFGMPGIEGALSRYRATYTPSSDFPEPTSFLPINVVVAASEAEAQERALPQAVQMARLRTGAPLLPQLTIEEAAAYEWTPREEAVRDAIVAGWLIGTPGDVATRLRARLGELGLDEAMIVPAAAAYAGEELDAPAGRAETLRLLAEAVAG